MRPARGHGTRKGCHYYTTEQLRRLVYSSERACPAHVRAIRRSSFAGSCIVVTGLAPVMLSPTRHASPCPSHALSHPSCSPCPSHALSHPSCSPCPSHALSHPSCFSLPLSCPRPVLLPPLLPYHVFPYGGNHSPARPDRHFVSSRSPIYRGTRACPCHVPSCPCHIIYLLSCSPCPCHVLLALSC